MSSQKEKKYIQICMGIWGAQSNSTLVSPKYFHQVPFKYFRSLKASMALMQLSIVVISEPSKLLFSWNWYAREKEI